MAPRKSVKISSPVKKDQAAPEKIPAKRQKKAALLKVPTVIRISIPSKASCLGVPNNQRRVDLKTKIALVNEVAKTQLQKKPVKLQPDSTSPPKKRGRQKKMVVSQYFNEATTKPEETPQPTTEKKDTKKNVATVKETSDATLEAHVTDKKDPKKKLTTGTKLSEATPEPLGTVKKNTKKNSETEKKTSEVNQEPLASEKKDTKKIPATGNKTITRKRIAVADSTVEKPKIKRKKIATKQVTNAEQNVASKPDTTKDVETLVKEQAKDDAKVFTPPKNSVRPRKRRLFKGKQESRTTSPILQSRCPRPKSQASTVSPKPPIKSPKTQEPRAESPKLEIPTKSIKKETDILDNNAAQVESRKTSISSNSNLSWTRDISSSSTTTCVTVASNDFVRFNKKMPFVKVTNISDSEVNKYKSISIPAADENSSSDDSSSSDSESETTYDQSKSCDRSQLSYDSPGNVKSLNLSSPSHDSAVTPIEDHVLNADPDCNKNDYRQAAQNLIHALKKIDTEFRSWLPKGVVESDLNCVKDKLFDILSSEFRAIAHCRNLQEISKIEIIDGLGAYDEVDDVIETHLETENRIVEGIKNNIIERDKLESKKDDTLDSNKNSIIESNQNNTVDNIERINVAETTEAESITENKNQCKTFNIIEHNRIETKKSDLFEQNKVENKRFSKFENIRIEINRTGTKKIECNSIENESKVIESTPMNVTGVEDEFIRPSTSGVALQHGHIISPQCSEPDDSSSEDSTSTEDDRSLTNNSHYDDDDALSLYAESLTGIESSKLNTSIVPPENPIEEYTPKPIEEYIPKPIPNTFVSPKNYTYCPTKIADENKNGIVKTVCEKQNADSTSISKDKEIDSLSSNLAYSVENKQELVTTPTNTPLEENIPDQSRKNGLLADICQLNPTDFHHIFKGICFFNLSHTCRATKYNQLCKYPHVIPDYNTIRNELVKYSEDLFMKEYVLLRRKHNLLRRYGMCFIEECVRRQLTRMLIEIVYDMIVTLKIKQDEALKVKTIEIALLYFNNLDLGECEDLLKLKHGDLLLCDIFMQTMTNTQNFSRFKSVFLNLTYFMVNNDRTFELNVAEQIVERVCILPFDEPLVRAVIQIIRLTNPKIFLNSSILHFEKQISVNKDVLEEYLSVKRSINPESLINKVVNRPQMKLVDQASLMQTTSKPFFLPVKATGSPRIMQTMDTLSVRPEMREGVPLPPSPDTTHRDVMNKTAGDPVVPKITRTIWAFNSSPHAQMVNMSPNSSNSTETVHNNWRNRSIFNQINRGNFSSPRRLMRPPMRSRPPGRLMRNRQFNHRLVTFGGSPIMYPPPGPDF